MTLFQSIVNACAYALGFILTSCFMDPTHKAWHDKKFWGVSLLCFGSYLLIFNLATLVVRHIRKKGQQ